MKVVFSDAANNDLREIAFHIAEDDYPRAMRFVADLRQACHALSCFPRRFPIWSAAGDSPIRRRTYRRYAIFYRVQDTGQVEILRIAHGARELDELDLDPETAS